MDTVDQVKKEASKQLQSGAKEVRQSAKDWYEYIQEHPLQSMLFGSVIYFAIKGFIKDLGG